MKTQKNSGEPLEAPAQQALHQVQEHPEDETRREKPLGRVKRTKLGDEAELVEREETKRKQPKTITAEAYLNALRMYIIDLARAGVEGRRDEPSAAETDGSQTYDHVQIPLEVTVNSHARVKRFTASLPRTLLPLHREELDRRLQPLQKQMKMSAVPHPHYLVDTTLLWSPPSCV